MKIISVFLLCGFLLIILSCAYAPVKTMEIGDIDASRHRVLIAMQQSEFKDAVISQVIDRLAKESCYIRVIDLKELEQELTDPYQAIVIANTCIAWNLDPAVERFLGNFRQPEKIILLITAGGEDCEPKSAQIDALTSASKMEKSTPVAQSITNRVLEVFSRIP